MIFHFQLKPPDMLTQYRAVGFLKARYLPSGESIQRGNFIAN